MSSIQEKNPLLEQGLFQSGRITLSKANGPTWTLAACGDFRPNWESHPLFEKESYPAQSIREWLAADLTVGNLEAPVAPSEDKLRQSPPPPFPFGPILHTPLTALDRAGEMGITHFTLANNHIKDFGPLGITETIQALDARGLGHFGAGNDPQSAAAFHYCTVNGTRIALGGFAQNEAIASVNGGPGANILHGHHVLESLQLAKKNADVVILFLHDGYEFSDVPRLEFFRLCRQSANAGATAIFCHHPHVPHGAEMINGCPIFYSLGNFIFRMNPHSGTPWSTRSFIPKLTFSGKELSAIEIIPFRLDDDFVPRPESGSSRDETLKHLETLSLLLNEHDIDESNRTFVKKHVWDVILDSVYEAGQRGDIRVLQWLKGQQLYKDPYLKAMKDGARLFRNHDDFNQF